MVKVGKLKGTRYYLNIPYLLDALDNCGWRMADGKGMGPED